MSRLCQLAPGSAIDLHEPSVTFSTTRPSSSATTSRAISPAGLGAPFSTSTRSAFLPGLTARRASLLSGTLKLVPAATSEPLIV